MQIKELVKKAHDNAVEKGFYDNPRELGTLLMLVVSELSEALEADRKNKKAEIENYEENEKNRNNNFYDIEKSKCINFETHIKDTFEDEIADVFIRLFDDCAYLNIQIEEIHPIEFEENNVTEIGSQLLIISKHVIDIWNVHPICRESVISILFGKLLYFCNLHNIDIKKHIELKMAYNENREKMHGKKY